jgi:AAA+ superfamily predicted ATPase
MASTVEICNNDGKTGLSHVGGMSLTPAQQRLANNLLAATATGSVCSLKSATAMGKTTVLRWLHSQLDATFVPIAEFMSLLKHRSPFALEETFVDALQQAMNRSETVLVDDLHLITDVVQAYDYPRRNLINTALHVVLSQAESCRKRFVFAMTGEEEPAPLRYCALTWEMDDWETEDFAQLCRTYLGEAAGRVEFEKVYRFAPTLNGRQLKNACLWLRSRPDALSTDSFIEFLRSHNLASNVDLEEVQPVAWADLQGMDDVIHELEAKIAFPFENDSLAMELGLKPKRGVLLAGPPGTGKTTIARALAHRLKGKFFLIDGTVNAGAGDFYERVDKVFEAAKSNAPSVIFIDDADVIFEDRNQGLYRYLLTMMDGLESASAERVCVMITAMDTSALPPALLRSGRVELWLTTRMPDENARATIFRERLAGLPPPISTVDIPLLAQRSSGLSGADLKSIVEEGKLLFAYAAENGERLNPVEDFFCKAIQNCRANRRKYGKKCSSSRTTSYGFPT